jgi:hypothetical protein
MDGGTFIRELCLALEHRWKPEQRFLLFTAYFDEADTHGPAPTIIMAGFLGTARQWELFERRLRGLQKRDGFNIFHSTEFKHQSGEFRGWDDPKCMRLVENLTELVRDELTEGLTVHLESERYVNEYSALPFPRKMPHDTQYGLCFRACLRHLIDMVLVDGKKHRLHVVIERGHKHVHDAERIFNDVKERLKTRRGIDLLGDFVIAKKEERAPLMVGDLLAGSYSMMRASQKAGALDYIAEAPEPPKGEAGLTFLEFLPGSLEQLKTDWEADRLERADAWRARRAAKRAGQVGEASASSGGRLC